MKYLVYGGSFIIFFILLYIAYYLLFVRKNLEYNNKKVSPDLRIFVGYYGIDIEKIGYQRVLRIMNFVNALMLAIMMMIVFNVHNTILKIIILLVLMIPIMWVTYYIVAIYLRHLERKIDNV